MAFIEDEKVVKGEPPPSGAWPIGITGARARSAAPYSGFPRPPDRVDGIATPAAANWLLYGHPALDASRLSFVLDSIYSLERPAAQAFLDQRAQPSEKFNKEFLHEHQDIIGADQGICLKPSVMRDNII